MKLGVKRPGSSTCFLDGVLDEALLQFSWKEDGSIGMAFHIYDSLGDLVADSGGVAPVAAVLISAKDGEVLLDIPSGSELHIRYRLYNSAGSLLTSSDGSRTHIFSYLRMESGKQEYGTTRRVSPPLPVK